MNAQAVVPASTPSSITPKSHVSRRLLSTMAAAPVEASSLSSLTAIAGNPPRYPRNPAEQKREPLVLYIARVPGSRGEHIHVLN